MAERLLLDGGKVKVTIMFRGREITYTAFGKRLLDRVAKDLENSAILEREAKLEGKNMFLILAPRATPLGPPRFVHLKTDTAHHEAETAEHHDDHDDHDEADDHGDDIEHDIIAETDAEAVATTGGANA
jgi:translation initiation factor IF-3